jgi:hypothetical protein
MQTGTDTLQTIVYWHRALPPLSADVVGEDVVEATSQRVQGSLSHRDDAWLLCYQDLLEQARIRLEQEVARRGGHYAHVHDESIHIRRDEARGETWLHGRFQYVLYREPGPASRPS